MTAHSIILISIREVGSSYRLINFFGRWPLLKSLDHLGTISLTISSPRIRKAVRTLTAAGHISCVPDRSQSLAGEWLRALEAAVCATMPGSGSWKMRMVMAYLRRRAVISLVISVWVAISSYEIWPWSGTKSAILNSAMACIHTELLC